MNVAVSGTFQPRTFENQLHRITLIHCTAAGTRPAMVSAGVFGGAVDVLQSIVGVRRRRRDTGNDSARSRAFQYALRRFLRIVRLHANASQLDRLETRRPKIIWEQAVSPPLAADPLIAAAHKRGAFKQFANRHT